MWDDNSPHGYNWICFFTGLETHGRTGVMACRVAVELPSKSTQWITAEKRGQGTGVSKSQEKIRQVTYVGL